MNRLLTLSLLILATSALSAQTPNAFNYQAALRDNQGALLNGQSVGLKIEIENASGVVYTEELVVQTNAFGIVNVQVGTSPSTSNSFSDIDWMQGPFALKIYVDPNGGQSYQFNSLSDILSVPYAKYAERSENLDHGYKLLNFLPLADRSIMDDYYLGHLMNGGFSGIGYRGFNSNVNNKSYGVYYNGLELNGYDSRLMIEAVNGPSFNLQGTAVALRYNHGSGTDYLWPDTSYKFFKDSTIISLSRGFKGFVDFNNHRQAPQEGVYEIIINPNSATETILTQKIRVVDGVFGN